MKVYVADYIGDKFGRLTIIADAGKYKNNSYKVLCKCDCGNTVETLLCRLLSGNTQSCGCLKSQLVAKRNVKHNLSNTHLYRIYMGIKNRCYNTKDLNYKKYGAKGILMADEWLGENGFHNFYTWADKNGYYYEKLPNGRSKLTIDRIDNDKGYSPENCRWATNEEQANNKKMNVIIEVNGEKIHLRQLAKELNMNFNTLFKRWKYTKMPIEKVIEKTDFRKNNRVIRKSKGDVI